MKRNNRKKERQGQDRETKKKIYKTRGKREIKHGLDEEKGDIF